MRRTLSILVSAALAVGVLATIGAAAQRGGHHTPVRGEVSPVAASFFADPAVRAELAHRGYDVHVDVTNADAFAAAAPGHDFAFVADAPAAEHLARDRHVATTYEPFSTPIAIASFTPVVRALAAAGVAHPRGPVWTLDMAAFESLVAHGTRWNDLPVNTSYRSSNPIAIASADPGTSGTAALYAALASTAANGGRVVTTPAGTDTVLGRVAPLFLDRGAPASSTEAAFDEYLASDAAAAPMTVIDESQFVERAGAHDARVRPDMVLVYPQPDVVADQTLVPFSPSGDAIGRLLRDDPTLQRLAARHGFRTSMPGPFDAFVRANHVAVAPDLAGAVEPPAYGVLEALTAKLDIAAHRPIGTRPGTPVGES